MINAVSENFVDPDGDSSDLLAKLKNLNEQQVVNLLCSNTNDDKKGVFEKITAFSSSK